MDELKTLFPDLDVGRGYARSDRVELPDVSPKNVGHGLGVADIDLERLVANDLRFDPREAPRLAEHGVCLQVHHSHSRVVALLAESADELLAVRGARGLTRHAGAVVVDTAIFEGPALLQAQGHDELLLLHKQGPTQDLTLDVFVRPLTLPARPTFESKVREWTGGDAWVTSEVERRLASGDPVDHVEAVGHVWRFQPRGSAQRKALLEGLRQGRPTADDLPARTWARTLAEPDARWVERRALATVARLEETLDRLLEEADTREPAWRSAMLELLVERDDLQSVDLVLQAARASDRLDRALDRLDREGTTAIQALPPWTLEGPPEQLRHSAERDPSTWWVQPVLEAS